jgi:hypothetical protein
MTSAIIQMQRQAIAVQRAAEVAEGLDPLNEPLRLAKNEPLPNDAHILAEVTASLAQVCLQQREQLIKLSARVEELEKAQFS